MGDQLGRKAINGAAWKFAERILAQGITTIVGIILARLLEPEHYGIIAIVNVFISICNVFVVSGFPESLIQKKDADDVDFTTIFYLNLSISLTLYAFLFFAAPAITRFYGKEYKQLTPIIRIMGLRLLLASINAIQHAKIARELAFKKYFYVTLVGTLISAFVGIVLAYSGFGVWALVAQYMTNTTIDTIMLFVFVRWIPRSKFSVSRVKTLGGYGIRLLFTALITTIINELEQLLIGKRYSSEDLAFYSKGKTYPKLLVQNISTAISSAIFPLLSKVQDDKAKTKYYASKSIKLISFAVFPCVIGLAAVANDFVKVLLTDKWLPCVPYLVIMCFINAIDPIVVTNSQCLTAQGNSKLYARITISMRAFGVVLLIITLRFGVLWIAFGRLFRIIVEYIVKTVPTKKIINYGLFEQLYDMLPNLIGCGLMFASVKLVSNFYSGSSSLISLILQVAAGAMVYIVYSCITKNSEMQYCLNIISRGRLGKRNG